MDILSDVKIAGNLTASGTICGEIVNATSRLIGGTVTTNIIEGGNLTGIILLAEKIDLFKHVKFDMELANFFTESQFNCAVTMCKQLTIQSSLKFDSGAKICGGEFTDKVLMEIPANCSKFQITDCTSSPVSIQAFMMDSGSNWNNVELDFKFEKIEDSESYKPIATISSAFTESKQMYFILGR